MLQFNSILLFSENPEKLTDFYKGVFEKEPEWSEEGYSGFTVGSCMFMIGPHDKVHGKSQNPERILFNFETNDIDAEFQRIENLGAEIIAKPYNPSESEEMKLATFADMDRNYFQIATPMKM